MTLANVSHEELADRLRRAIPRQYAPDDDAAVAAAEEADEIYDELDRRAQNEAHERAPALSDSECGVCGGDGGERTLVCCGNWRPGKGGEPVCCDQPVLEQVSQCPECGL